MTIRFKKMFCVGLLLQNNIIGGFMQELAIAPEVVQFFIWRFAKKQGYVLFINKIGRPVFIAPESMTLEEQKYWGINNINNNTKLC